MSPTTCNSIRDRTTFTRLRRPTGQARCGPVRVRHLPPRSPAASDRAEVGYAIGRGYGAAVRRNRARRRLQAAVGEVVGTVPPGTYLLTAEPSLADLGFSGLVTAVGDAMLRAAAGTARRSTGQAADQ